MSSAASPPAPTSESGRWRLASLPMVFGGAGSSRRARVVAAALVGLWLAGVLYVVMHHEFWRDEVRAFSLVRIADSPLALVRLVADEGHPLLWYALLYIGHAVAEHPVVLPVVSILVGLAAVALFVWRAPFPLWLEALFVFGALASYEYSVMARNYGISMLLLFLWAALYPGQRRRPIALAVVLALLANTNAHSVLLVVLLSGVWIWDALASADPVAPRRRARALVAPVLIVVAGILLSALVAYPKPHTIVTDARTMELGELLRSAAATALRPAEAFRQVVPVLRGPVDQLLLYVAALGLLPRIPLFLAAAGAILGLGVFFDVVYPGAYRHHGLVIVFLLALYWMGRGTAGASIRMGSSRVVAYAGLIAVAVLLVDGMADARRFVRRDLARPLSGSEALGAFLTRSDRLRDAIVVPEPDYLIEALPYYADNPIYLPREGRFSPVASFTTRAQVQLTLDELLDEARSLATRTDRPVVLVLGFWDLDTNPRRVRRLAYDRWFTWDDEQLARLRRETELVAEIGDVAGDERFRVHLLR